MRITTGFQALCAASVLTFTPGCRRCDPDAVDYTPVERDDWVTSTPEEQGLDPDAVAAMYCDAQLRDRLYGLLVVKNGVLVAEDYFNVGSIDQLSSRASVTKSFTSSAVGAALDQGCLTSVDQKMLEFFPEVVDDIEDSRKHDITVRHLLQMRAGYPWEETDPALWDVLLAGEFVPAIADIPLTAAPGTTHQYSNLSSNWLSIIVSRACDTDLQTFAEEHVLTPISAEVGFWLEDVDGYRVGSGELQITARDMAKFGQLYLDEGQHDGEQVLPADWVRDSFGSYSEVDSTLTPGPEFDDYSYGYQWWSAQAGPHHVDFAWGHGGSFIFLVDALDLVVVVTADPFTGEHSDRSWRHERAHLNLVGAFINSLETSP